VCEELRARLFDSIGQFVRFRVVRIECSCNLVDIRLCKYLVPLPTVSRSSVAIRLIIYI